MPRKRKRGNIRVVVDYLKADLNRCNGLLEREQLTLKRRWTAEGRKAGVLLGLRLVRKYINE